MTGGAPPRGPWARRLVAVRLGLAVFLLWPFAWFAMVYVWQFGTVDGLVPAVALATLDGVGEALAAAAADPLQSLVYAVFLWGVGRVAFGRRRDRCGLRRRERH